MNLDPKQIRDASKDTINSIEPTEPSLSQEQSQQPSSDNSYSSDDLKDKVKTPEAERGIPQDLSVRADSKMRTVAMLVLGLFVVGLFSAAFMRWGAGWFSKEPKAEKQSIETTDNGGTSGRYDFTKSQQATLAAAASEVELVKAASEPEPKQEVASEAKVNLRQVFESRNIQSEQWNLLSAAAGKLAVCPLFIDDSSTLNTMDLRGRCRRFFAKQQSDKGLVVLDYLQLMDAAGKIENRQQEVSAISRALKGIAREFKVPVLALSQLSRDVEKRGGSKKPQLSDLRDSGAIEQDADMVIFLYREAYYAQEESQDSTAEVIVAKNRNGPTGKVNLVFFKEYARFENGIGMNM